jgi:hypothetical protein
MAVTPTVGRDSKENGMQGFSLGLLCSLCLLSVAEAATPAELPASETAGLTVHYEQGLLTVEAREVEVGRLFQEVARQSGVTLALANPWPTPVTLSFAQQPLEAGLHSILRALQGLGRVSYLMFYDETASLTQLQVYLHAQAASAPRAMIPPPPQDLSQHQAIPVLPMEGANPIARGDVLGPMEKAQPPQGSDEITPMEQAQPPPGGREATAMERAEPVPEAAVVAPMPTAPPPEGGLTDPMEKAAPRVEKGGVLPPLQSAPGATH